jgi:hydroxymethylpyrimidine/phosphomethylpyrimidine kinase
VTIPRVLVIAGSDSGGGAGIQADIKTITMLGGHAMTAITAITAQNTLGVQAVHGVPTAMVMAQIDAVATDIGVDAVKIGMIGSAETANAVADWLARRPEVPVVFDPVMVATSGGVLADAATVAAFTRLMTLATLVTPNLPELSALAGAGDSETMAARLASRHGCAVLVKGGHDEGAMVSDALVMADGGVTRWQHPRVTTRHSHGTGCTLASAIAVALAAGVARPDAIEQARAYVRAALLASPGLGAGSGPIGHALGGVPAAMMGED